MERPRERKFKKEARCWVGLSPAIPPWTFERCFKTPDPKNIHENTTVTFESFESKRETYRASQVFVEH